MFVPVPGRVDPAVRAVRHDLGPAAHDGPDDGGQPRLRVRHLHHARRHAACRARGGSHTPRHATRAHTLYWLIPPLSGLPVLDDVIALKNIY